MRRRKAPFSLPIGLHSPLTGSRRKQYLKQLPLNSLLGDDESGRGWGLAQLTIAEQFEARLLAAVIADEGDLGYACQSQLLNNILRLTVMNVKAFVASATLL